LRLSPRHLVSQYAVSAKAVVAACAATGVLQCRITEVSQNERSAARRRVHILLNRLQLGQISPTATLEARPVDLEVAALLQFLENVPGEFGEIDRGSCSEDVAGHSPQLTKHLEWRARKLPFDTLGRCHEFDRHVGVYSRIDEKLVREAISERVQEIAIRRLAIATRASRFLVIRFH